MVWWCFLGRFMWTCSPSRRRTGGSSLAQLVVVGRGRSWNGGGDERVGAHLSVIMVVIFILCHCSNKPYKWRIKSVKSCLVQLLDTLSFFSLMRKRDKVTSIRKTLTIFTNVITKLLMTIEDIQPGLEGFPWELLRRRREEPALQVESDGQAVIQKTRSMENNFDYSICLFKVIHLPRI